MKNKQAGFIIPLIIGVVVIAGLIGGAVYLLNKNKPGKGVGNSQSANCSGKGTVQMTHMPMDLKDVGSIMPMGLLAGAHVTPIDHLYFYPKDMAHRDAAPVYAMADGFITGYTERGASVDTGQARPTEYRLFIQYTCDFYSYYDLMTSIDPSIAGKMKNGELHVAIKSGQVLGKVGAQSLDTAIYNYAMTLPGFINPDTYKAEDWKIHADDFFKYFDEPQRSQMLALNARKVEPYSGKIDYDVVGKLRGNWFLEGSGGYAGPPQYQNGQNPDGKGYWAGHLSIAPDAIDPTLLNISFGDYQGQATQFTAVSALPDPAQVGVSDGMTAYELTTYIKRGGDNHDMANPSGIKKVSGTVLFQVLDGNKLKMETFPGKTKSEVTAFSSAVKTYVR